MKSRRQTYQQSYFSRPLRIAAFLLGVAAACGSVEQVGSEDAAPPERDASAVLCETRCSPGATRCVGDGVAICETTQDGCTIWTEPTACGASAPYCSHGVCNEFCIDECADGETRCDGLQAVLACGQADGDECRDWLPATQCEDDRVCSNGACGSVCQDECTEGQTACFGSGVTTCGDLNQDGCTEWGPASACSTGLFCQDGECTSECEDECSVDVCSDPDTSHQECGQFDLDSCLELSPGRSCDSGDPCQIDTCAPGVGCLSEPKHCDTPPEGECVGANTLRVFHQIGRCDADGSCQYDSQDVVCPNCPSCDACEGVVCDQPPGQCFADTGVCSGGRCEYEPDDSLSCSDGNACTINECQGGQCVSTPKSCSSPPPPTCAGSHTRRTYSSSGVCDAATGNCSYTPVDSPCLYGCASGNCKSGPTIVREDFSSTSRWVREGGDSDGFWRSSNRLDNRDYPSNASGNPVVRAQDCDSTCYFKFNQSIDLRSFSRVTLSLLRYIDDDLDTGEYLSVQVFRQGKWRTKKKWGACTSGTSCYGGQDDDRWHREQIDLSDAAGHVVWLRVGVKASKANEVVEVDDIRLDAFQ